MNDDDLDAIRAQRQRALDRDLWHPALDDIGALLAEVERLQALLGDAGVRYTGPSADAEFQAEKKVGFQEFVRAQSAEAERDTWRLRWQQLMRDHEVVTAERDRAETIADRVEALADEWEAGQAVNRRALKNREFMPYEPPNPADLRAAIEGTDS